MLRRSRSLFPCTVKRVRLSQWYSYMVDTCVNVRLPNTVSSTIVPGVGELSVSRRGQGLVCSVEIL